MSDTQRVMEGDASSGSAGPAEWGSAVASGDATKLAELVLFWSGSKPERALALLRNCVSLLEKEVAEPTGGSCLEALIVAFNETCDGKSWYTSTKELQLASLEFCIACRNNPTVHMNVDERIPRRLLAAADAPPPHPKRLCQTRVPRLQARGVTWNMPTAAELRNPIFAMKDIDFLKFGDAFNDSLKAVEWPHRLETLEFGVNFNNPIEEVEWPPSLRHLKFGLRFNQPIQWVRLPASLLQLVLTGAFNHPIEDVAWPSALRQLEFGQRFNQPIQRVRFPASLLQLFFGGDFNHPIEEVAWPSALRQLEFGFSFNQPIQLATFPASLHQLIFAGGFNQPIEDVLWPACLQGLAFGTCFNQPVDNVRWPVSLQEVAFGWCSELQRNDVLMYSKFNQRIGRSVWPASLRRLTVGGEFRQSLQGLGTWMPKLEALRVLDWEYDPHFNTFIYPQNGSLLHGIEWPKGLRELTVLEQSSLDGVAIPSTVKVYCPRLVH
ncbi:unnamed protein product [Ectocarpus sp. 12 AP-2014]